MPPEPPTITVTLDAQSLMRDVIDLIGRHLSVAPPAERPMAYEAAEREAREHLIRAMAAREDEAFRGDLSDPQAGELRGDGLTPVELRLRPDAAQPVSATNPEYRAVGYYDGETFTSTAPLSLDAAPLRAPYQTRVNAALGPPGWLNAMTTTSLAFNRYQSAAEEAAEAADALNRAMTRLAHERGAADGQEPSASIGPRAIRLREE